MGIGERGNNGLREGGNYLGRKIVTLVTPLDASKCRLSNQRCHPERSLGIPASHLRPLPCGKFSLAVFSTYHAEPKLPYSPQTLRSCKGSFDSAVSSRCEDAAAQDDKA